MPFTILTMKIEGFVKSTLQDFPGNVAAICFIGGCQLRCPFCHNPETVVGAAKTASGVTSQRTAFIAYIEKRAKQLDGLVISGGEPLLQPDLLSFIKKMRELGLKIKLDTNGIKSNALVELLDRGLIDYVAVDFKNTRPNFSRTTGTSMAEILFDQWEESLYWLRIKDVPYEIRTTVVKELHDRNSLLEMAKFLSTEAPEDETWYLQSFNKNGPIINDFLESEASLSSYTLEELREIVEVLKEVYPGVKLRG